MTMNTNSRLGLAVAALWAAGIATANAQDFPGLRTSNYAGVNSVFFNPAAIADSRYRFDVNILAIQAQAGNKEASFKLSGIGHSFKGDSAISAQLFGKNNGKANGLANLALHGPSVMFNAGNKYSFAVTTRSRLLMNFRDLDGRLARQIIDKDLPGTQYPYTISSNGSMRINATGWTEFGATVAREVLDKGKHFVKAGITVKYLAGTGNAYVNVTDFNGVKEFDASKAGSHLVNTTGQIGMGFSGVKTDGFEIGDLTKFNSSGIGADLGFVYEFRPDYEKLHEDAQRWNDRVNKYKLRVGVAITDIGRLKFNPDADRSGNYDIHIKGSEWYDPNELKGVEVDNYSEYFSSRNQFFTRHANTEKYSVSLPTALHVDADYYIEKGFYVNLATQLSLAGNKTKVYNSTYYNSVSLTPRWEKKTIGVYLPLNYSQLTKFNVGLGAHLGPVFFGSGSIFNLLFGGSRQADAQFGIHVYGLKKVSKKKKVVTETGSVAAPIN